MATTASDWRSQWITKNKLQAWESKFVEEDVDLADLQALETEEEIDEFIRDTLQETKKLKIKRIKRAIQAAQASVNEVALVLKRKDLKFDQIVSVKQDSEIEKAYQSNSGVVDRAQKRFYNVDVQDVMRKLATCGELIKFALYNSNGCSCNSAVMRLMSKYHNLVKNSFIGSAKFVSCGVTALEYHKLAYDVLPKSPTTSITFISRCSELAAAMAKVSEQLMDEAQVLRDDAEDALVTAADDRKGFSDRKAQMIKDIAAAKARREELESLKESQAAHISLLQKREQKAIERADKERSEKLVMGIFKQVAGAVGNAIGAMNPAAQVANVVNAASKGADGQVAEEKEEEEPASADALAMQINQQLYEAEKEQIKQNAELKKKIAQLKNMKDEKDTIKKAMEAIELTIKALGKIKVIFANVRMFWQGVEAQCQNLAGVGGTIQKFNIAPHKCQQQILDLVEESALNWFTLLKVNYYGKEAIAKVDKQMDGILDNLKDANEARKMVDEMAQMLVADLDSEDAQFARKEAAMKEAAKAVTDGKEDKPYKVHRRPKDAGDD